MTLMARSRFLFFCLTLMVSPGTHWAQPQWIFSWSNKGVEEDQIQFKLNIEHIWLYSNYREGLDSNVSENILQLLKITEIHRIWFKIRLVNRGSIRSRLSWPIGERCGEAARADDCGNDDLGLNPSNSTTPCELWANSLNLPVPRAPEDLHGWEVRYINYLHSNC